jgi:hypothetical protein
MSANGCDHCSRERATLYDVGESLICLMCLSDSWVYGANVWRALRAAVTGSFNIERRRRRMRGH